MLSLFLLICLTVVFTIDSTRRVVDSSVDNFDNAMILINVIIIILFYLHIFSYLTD